MSSTNVVPPISLENISISKAVIKVDFDMHRPWAILFGDCIYNKGLV